MSKIRQNIILNAIKTVTSIAFPLITFPYASRVLGAESIGKINFGSSIISYFSLLASLGIFTYAVRECSSCKGDRSKLSETSSQIYSLNIITMCISYLILISCLIFVPKLAGYRVLLIIQCLSIYFSINSVDWINTALEDYKYITIRSFAVQVLSLLAMFIFVHTSQDYYIYAFLNSFAGAVTMFLNRSYVKKYCDIKFTFRIDLKKHFSGVVLMFALLLSQNIMNNIDVTLLGFIKGDFAVGQYSAATKIINIVSQLITSVTFVVLPQLTRLFAESNYSKINVMLSKAFSLTITIGLPCVIGLIVLAPEILLIIAGSEYLEAVTCMRLMAVYMLVSFFCNIYCNMVLLPAKKEFWFMIGCMVAALSKFALGLAFIPAFGINAAAVTSIIAQLMIWIISIFHMPKGTRISNKFKSIASSMAGGVGIVLMSILFSCIDNLYIKTFVTVMTSVIAYFAMMVLTKNDALDDIFNRGNRN